MNIFFPLKIFPIILITSIISSGCSLPTKSTQTIRPFWGDSIDKVIQIEKNRLGTDPVKRQRSGDGRVEVLLYNDRIFSTDSNLSYYFQNKKLIFMVYSSSDPDWDKDEFNFQVHNKLSNLYGKPHEIRLGVKTCYHWIASDAFIYYVFRRKHQDRTFWRSFLAVIVYSSQTLEESDLLRNVLGGIE